MRVSAKSWSEYVERLSRLNQKAGKLMKEYIDRHGMEDTDALIAYANALVTKYGEGSAELAAQMYDAMAAAEGASVPAAVPAATASYSEVAQMVTATQNSPPLMPLHRQVSAGIQQLHHRPAGGFYRWNF